MANMHTEKDKEGKVGLIWLGLVTRWHKDELPLILCMQAD
jgi:hypothetical protein